MMVERAIVNAAIAEDISSSGIEISLLPSQEEMKTPIIVLDVPTYMIGGAGCKRSGRALKTLMKKMKRFTGANNNASPTNSHKLCEEKCCPSMNYTMSELTGQSSFSEIIRSNETSLSSFLFIKRWREKTSTASTGAEHPIEENSDILSGGEESGSKSILFIEKWKPGLKTCHESSSSQQ